VDEDRLAEAKEAQERVFALQASGIAANSPEARQAVNRLMVRLRTLSQEERAAFDAWRAGQKR
jgi:hypothetical protein